MPPLPDQGCTFEEAAVALACAHPDIAYCVQAKREVGKLWEDIAKPPYTILFNSSTNAVRLWRLVEIMRIVDGLLKTLHSVQGGKVKLVATHGNRFILHIVCRSVSNLYGDSMPTDITDVVGSTVGKLLDPSKKLFESSYPSNFFKNASKCKETSASILGAQA